MTKKILTTPEFDVYRINRGMWTQDIGVSTHPEEEDDGSDAVATRQDFFGNTILVPIDDDWE